MTIKLSPKNWGRVLKGESFTIRGDGYRLDCGNFVSFQWDYWVFEVGINGHLAVEIRTPLVKETSPDHAYNGSMKEVETRKSYAQPDAQIYEISRKKKIPIKIVEENSLLSIRSTLEDIVNDIPYADDEPWTKLNNY
jgi:hypothetical protein